MRLHCIDCRSNSTAWSRNTRYKTLAGETPFGRISRLSGFSPVDLVGGSVFADSLLHFLAGSSLARSPRLVGMADRMVLAIMETGPTGLLIYNRNGKENRDENVIPATVFLMA